MVRRYGLDGRNKTTLNDLARELGIPQEQVRRLQHEAEHFLKTFLETGEGGPSLHTEAA